MRETRDPVERLRLYAGKPADAGIIIPNPASVRLDEQMNLVHDPAFMNRVKNDDLSYDQVIRYWQGIPIMFQTRLYPVEPEPC